MSIKIEFRYVNAADVKATKIFYTDSDSSSNVEIEVSVFHIAENQNLWTNLEIYRQLVRDSQQDLANSLFEKIESRLYGVIDKFSNPFPDFEFDTFIAFYPEDKNRRKLLKFFIDNITNGIKNIAEIDKSNSFEKNDKYRSVKDGLTTSDFTLDEKSLIGMKKLLLVDDVIDCGRTIKIFLDKLIENGIDLTKVEIKLICLYHNSRSAGIKSNCT
ncbi:hypothetical protein EZS27_021043 [termite gut metagenome]|uniref:Phosphoribosyltransferase domain-containing protein n=1 Tax=termite gut metagenome TaxID=433724 RepID=A0A5J4R912_9ZZZZ